MRAVGLGQIIEHAHQRFQQRLQLSGDLLEVGNDENAHHRRKQQQHRPHKAQQSAAQCVHRPHQRQLPRQIQWLEQQPYHQQNGDKSGGVHDAVGDGVADTLRHSGEHRLPGLLHPLRHILQNFLQTVGIEGVGRQQLSGIGSVLTGQLLLDALPQQRLQPPAHRRHEAVGAP